MLRIVREVAGGQDSWRCQVRYTSQRRWFGRLALSDDYEIWLLSWLPGQHTGFHDHGSAAGAFTVAAGQLGESLAAVGCSHVSQRVAEAGSVTTFSAHHRHDMMNCSPEPGVSVHAYSPPLTAMRRYEMTATGLVLAGTDRAELDW